MTISTDIFTLENFEGPLDFLWQLIHRQEIDIYQISISLLTAQYLSHQVSQDSNLDKSAEFIALAASLVLYKSKSLLPKHEQQQGENQEEELDPQFNIIHQLLDYCRFKQAAKELAHREYQQSAFYSRGVESAEAKKHLGIAHLSLEDLAVLFQQILAKTTPREGTIQEEEWKVSDKIKSLRKWLTIEPQLPFYTVFSPMMSRMELIVTFLALLEMMKAGEAKVISDQNSKMVYISALPTEKDVNHG
jgi:segregation and condensation protein A